MQCANTQPFASGGRDLNRSKGDVSTGAVWYKKVKTSFPSPNCCWDWLEGNHCKPGAAGTPWLVGAQRPQNHTTTMQQGPQVHPQPSLAGKGRWRGLKKERAHTLLPALPISFILPLSALTR